MVAILKEADAGLKVAVEIRLQDKDPAPFLEGPKFAGRDPTPDSLDR